MRFGQVKGRHAEDAAQEEFRKAQRLKEEALEVGNCSVVRSCKSQDARPKSQVYSVPWRHPKTQTSRAAPLYTPPYHISRQILTLQMFVNSLKAAC